MTIHYRSIYHHYLSCTFWQQAAPRVSILMHTHNLSIPPLLIPYLVAAGGSQWGRWPSAAPRGPDTQPQLYEDYHDYAVS
jgi:hypothetical protein